jgi:hypothetical protein
MEILDFSLEHPISCVSNITHRTSRSTSLLLRNLVFSKGKSVHLASNSNLKYLYHLVHNINTERLPLRDLIPTDGKISMSP